jgi:hypothetical protein
MKVVKTPITAKTVMDREDRDRPYVRRVPERGRESLRERESEGEGEGERERERGL